MFVVNVDKVSNTIYFQDIACTLRVYNLNDTNYVFSFIRIFMSPYIKISNSHIYI